jgi:hypothetical protein
MNDKWKDRLEKIGIGVFTAVAVVVLGALIKGDELKGLGKLTAFLRILNFGIPLWLFIVVLVAAILGAIQWIRQSQKKKILYAVWDPVQCLWGTGAIGDTPAMQLIMKGLFSNSDLEQALLITQVYLEGTKATLTLLEPLQIPAHHSVNETVHAFVQPVVGKKGHPYKGTLILIDQFKRKHRLAVELRNIDPIITK